MMNGIAGTWPMLAVDYGRIARKSMMEMGRDGACVPARAPYKGASIIHFPRTMRVFLVWKRRCADVRAGMPIGIPSRYDNIKRMAEMEKYHSEGLRGLFSKFGDHSEGLRGLFSKFDAHSEGPRGLFSKFGAHSEGLRGLFSKFDDHSEGLQGIFQLSETMPIQKR